MAPADADGPPLQRAFLTNATRRRSVNCSSMKPSSDAGSADHSSRHSASQHGPAACCSSPAQHDHSGGPSGPSSWQQGPVPACAPPAASPRMAGCSAANAAAASHHRVPLRRTSSSGPVTTRIHAAAICCPMESRLIHNILDTVPGVLSVEVMVVTKIVAVHHDPAAISPAALVAALNSAGLQASLSKHSTSGGAAPAAAAAARAGGACSSSCCSIGRAADGAQEQMQPRSVLAQLLAAARGSPSLPPLYILVSGMLLVVNLLLLLPGVGAPSLLRQGLLALIAAAIAIPPVLKKAWMGLKNRNLDMNSLVVVALFGAVGLGDFIEAGALVVLFTLAEWLEDRCVQRAAGAMEDILKLQPEEALVISQDEGDVQHTHSSACHHHCHEQHHAHQQQQQQEQHAQQLGKQAGEAGSCGQHCSAADHGHHKQHTGEQHQQQHRHSHAHGPGCSNASSCCHTHQHGHDHADDCHSHSCDSSSHSGCGGNSGSKHAAGAGDPHASCLVHSGPSSPCCPPPVKQRSVRFQEQKQHDVPSSQLQLRDDHQHHHHHHHHHDHSNGGGGGCCGHEHAGEHGHSHAAGEHQHSCCTHAEPGQQQQQHAHHEHHHHEQQQHPGQQQQVALKSVPVSQLAAGVLVLVRPGDKLPVDGLVEHGSSVVDESMITGESRPVTKGPGDAVLAGTINCGSVALRVRATADPGDSTVARLGAIMEAAAASKSRHDMAVELFARYYTPAIVLVALLVAGVGSAVQPSAWRHWTYMSLVVLVTGCPCALVISTPVASVAGLTRAARKGVLIKGGRALELLGNLSAASFDKSGTLTEGHFQLSKVQTFSGFSKQQALQLAALLEQHSNHPIAHAIVGAAAAAGCLSSGGAAGALAVTEAPGKGLSGVVGGQAVAIGSWGFAQELLAEAHARHSDPGAPAAAAAAAADGAGSSHSCTPACSSAAQQHRHDQHQQAAVLAQAKQLLSSADTAGATVVCLVVEVQLAALLLLSDRARPDARTAVQQLQKLGVRCLMMTGDSMGAAVHVAGQLGIKPDDVCAELLPQEKLELIGSLREQLASQRQLHRRRPAAAAAAGDQHSFSDSSSGNWWGRWGHKLRHGGGVWASGGSGLCSSCGEPAGDCSCCVVLGPESSSHGRSTRRSIGGGLQGTSGSGVRVDAAAVLRHTDSSNNGSSSSSGSRRAAPRGVVIAHVGDGINDAPALAGADVGIAMGLAGAALAVDAADVALFSNNLTSLPFAVRLGRRAGWIVVFNTVFACSIKLAVLGAAAGGAASLWLSLLADVGSSLLVTIHALTLLRFEASQDSSSSGSSGLGSRLSGIPVIGEHSTYPAGDAQHQAVLEANGAAVTTSSSSSSDKHGLLGGVGRAQWLQQQLARLPGLGWLRPYEQLQDHTPAPSAGASRLNSSSRRPALELSLPQSSVPCCAAKGSPAAQQEVREMAILACTSPPGGASGVLLGGSCAKGCCSGHCVTDTEQQ